MEKQHQHTLKLQLRTITPVAVGGDKGDILSPYADFIFSEDKTKLHYLNLTKVGNAVARAGLLDDYVQGVRLGMNNNRSIFNLEVDILDKLPEAKASFITRTAPHFGLDTATKQVMAVVKNAGVPYIPGSSIKGAIRTAVLYDWLLNTKAGKAELKIVVQKLGPLFEIREEIFELKKAIKEQFDPQKKNQIYKLEGEARLLEKDIFNEVQLFGPLNIGPDARFIRVSDTQPVNAIEIHALRRIRIIPGEGKRSSAIPQTLESIASDTNLDFEISILPEFKNAALSYWKTDKFEGISGVLNQFSKACIQNEIIELSDALELKPVSNFEEEVQQLLAFYQNLLQRVEAGEILLRLGFGKTINDNSLILALINGLEGADRQAIHDFRGAFHKVFRKNDFFPITRSINYKGEPMGWVEIKAIQ